MEIMHDAPQERMQTCTLEQTAAFPVPQISAERVPDRSPEQIMNFPVSQNMEAYAGRVRDIPGARAASFLRASEARLRGFLATAQGFEAVHGESVHCEPSSSP